MGAGTAQKIALNMLSTLMATELGHVHDGLMVNVVADNAKLQARAARIVAAVAGVDDSGGRLLLERAGGAVKPAILIAAGAADPAAAQRLLASNGMRVRPRSKFWEAPAPPGITENDQERKGERCYENLTWHWL